MKKIILLATTHVATLALGFGLGVYLLPVLTAASAPDAAVLAAEAEAASYTATLTRDLKGSDGFHWGEGTLSVTPTKIIHQGALGPGPDYKVYLAPRFVEDEAAFNAIKAASVQIGSVKSYDGFIAEIPAGVDIEDYTTVVIWCEAFGEFITAGKYR